MINIRLIFFMIYNKNKINDTNNIENNSNSNKN